MNRFSQIIPLSGSCNTRDLGGLPGKDGKTIRHNCLLRSGALAGLTQEDKRVLTEDYGLRLIIDFRTGLEREQKPDPEMDGVRQVHNPILSEAAVGFTRESAEAADPMESFFRHASGLLDHPETYVEKLYRNLVQSDTACRQYGCFLDLLLGEPQETVLWHCSAGKDRAGMGTVMLLAALGVPTDVIEEDFVKTNDYLKEETEALAVKAAEWSGNDEALVRAARILNSVDRIYLTGALDSILQSYHSIENYLEKKVGLTPEKAERLRARYLV